MTRNFCRWEVDPFFSAAEEVQDSADRLESAYRTWLHAKCVATDLDEKEEEEDSAIQSCRRGLSTALGTAKWQLEEFERAISRLHPHDEHQVGDDAASSERHKQFIYAIQLQIASIQEALLNSEDVRDLKALPVVTLEQEDRDNLAHFLSGSRASLPWLSYPDGDSLQNFPSAKKENNEGPSTSSASLESKSALSGSASSSYTALLNTRLSKPVIDPHPHRNRISENHGGDPLNIHGILAMDFLEIKAEHSDKAVSGPASEQMRANCVMNGEREWAAASEEREWAAASGERKCSHSERGNGQQHRKSGSVGSGLNTWKSGHIFEGTKICEHLQAENNLAGSHLWSFFRKRQPCVELKMSKSGFKRWKDGEVKSKDCSDIFWCYKLMQSTGDIEQGSGDFELPGNSNGFKKSVSSGILSSDNKLHKSWGGAVTSLQRLQHALPSRGPVQIASGILAALGLVGLFSFYAAWLVL